MHKTKPLEPQIIGNIAHLLSLSGGQCKHAEEIFYDQSFYDVGGSGGADRRNQFRQCAGNRGEPRGAAAGHRAQQSAPSAEHGADDRTGAVADAKPPSRRRLVRHEGDAVRAESARRANQRAEDEHAGQKPNNMRSENNNAGGKDMKAEGRDRQDMKAEGRDKPARQHEGRRPRATEDERGNQGRHRNARRPPDRPAPAPSFRASSAPRSPP